jgi:hypothetical protein
VGAVKAYRAETNIAICPPRAGSSSRSDVWDGRTGDAPVNEIGSVAFRETSVCDCLFGSDAGQRPHLERGVDLGVATLRRGQRADDVEHEGQRYRHDAGVGQREPGEVEVGEHRGLRARDGGGEDD